MHKGITVVEGGVCSGCLSSLRHSLDKLEFENKIEHAVESTIYMGKTMPNTKTLKCWKGELWLFGNCAVDLVISEPKRRLDHTFLTGCPPHVLDFYTAVNESIPPDPQEMSENPEKS